MCGASSRSSSSSAWCFSSHRDSRTCYSDNNSDLVFPNHLQEHVIGDIYFAAREHLLLALLLLLAKFHLSRDIAAVHMLGDVFLHRGFAARGKNAAATFCLDLEFEHLPRQ